MPATLPPDLLRAIAERSGRIALVVGAGCSVETPTNLHLSTFYAQQVHHELVLDGLLTVGECTDPSDLSAVASALQTKRASQSDLVKRLVRMVELHGRNGQTPTRRTYDRARSRRA